VLEHVYIPLEEFRRFRVEGVVDVELIEAASEAEQQLPDVIGPLLPLGERLGSVEFSGGGVYHGVEGRRLKDDRRANAIWKAVRNVDGELEGSTLVIPLPDEDDAEPDAGGRGGGDDEDAGRLLPSNEVELGEESVLLEEGAVSLLEGHPIPRFVKPSNVLLHHALLRWSESRQQ